MTPAELFRKAGQGVRDADLCYDWVEGVTSDEIGRAAFKALMKLSHGCCYPCPFCFGDMSECALDLQGASGDRPGPECPMSEEAKP